MPVLSIRDFGEAQMAIWDGLIEKPIAGTAAQDAVRQMLQVLVETDACHALVERLATAARSAYLYEGCAVIRYGDDDIVRTLKFGAPYKGPIPDDVPPSYLRLALETNGIFFQHDSRADWMLKWFGLSPEGEMMQIDRGYHLRDPGPGPRRVAISLWGGWIVYDPVARTQLGEAAMCRYQFGVMSEPLDPALGLPSTLLRLLVHDILEAGRSPPEPRR